MIPGRVSVVIPSRNERFLVNTVNDLLRNAAGDLEIVVVLEGYWPGHHHTDPYLKQQLPEDKRIKVLHRGEARGMRAAINDAVQMSTGEFILKADAHTAWAHGYDEVLKRDYHEQNWLLVPRRYPLDPDRWGFEQRRDGKYPIDYHYLVEPFGKYGDHVPGLHGTFWRERRDSRKDRQIDDELASQGSAWFCSRSHWNRIGPLDASLYGSFWFENQEMSLKTWCMGGRQMVTKNTNYAHWYKGKRGRGYSTRNMGHEAATAFTSWFWMTDQPFKGKVRNFRHVIESFLPMPTWSDTEAIFRRAHDELRNPYKDRTLDRSTVVTQHRRGPVKVEVTKAVYGISRDESVDVTEAVRKMVAGERLSIPRVTNERLGVGAVFPGKRKVLYVDYAVAEVFALTAEVRERQSLHLPVNDGWV